MNARKFQFYLSIDSYVDECAFLLYLYRSHMIQFSFLFD